MSNQSALNDSLNKLSELSSSGEVARINRSKRSSRHKSESAKSLLGNLLDDSIATADAEREREEERKRREEEEAQRKKEYEEQVAKLQAENEQLRSRPNIITDQYIETQNVRTQYQFPKTYRPSRRKLNTTDQTQLPLWNNNATYM